MDEQDIVTRLRQFGDSHAEAADEIERLQTALAETSALLDDCQERLSEVLHDLDESHRMTAPTEEHST